MTTVRDANDKECAVISAEAKSWRDADEFATLANARIVGRAVVDIEGGGRYHALLVEIGRCDELHYERRAVFWDRRADAFRTVLVRHESGAW